MNKAEPKRISLNELLLMQLYIPQYQRSYCWEKEHIESLLESLWNAKPDIQYHLGTIILHKIKEKYNIVDGQQRLISLSILNYLMTKQSCSILKSLTNDKDVIKRLFENRETILDWLSCHSKLSIDFSNITFTVVTIWWEESCSHKTIDNPPGQECKLSRDEDIGNYEYDPSLPLAWTFFNAMNSGGKPLSDYELLKAHHLRHLSMANDDSLIQYKASKWDSNGEQRITSFSSSKLYEASLAHTFYLIRSWLKNRAVKISELPADSRYCILNHYSALLSFPDAGGTMNDLTSGVIGGKQFFDWTEYWMWQFNRFSDNPVVKRLKCVPWVHAQQHLLIIAHALLFYYFSKFGDVYLADACIFILYRISRLRNKTARQKNAWYGNKDFERCVPHTAVALEESPSPEYFFEYCQMLSNRYVRCYNLKDNTQNRDQKYIIKNTLGLNWWKNFLAFAASGIDKSSLPQDKDACIIPNIPQCNIGDSVCFKEQIAKLLNDAANDFKWEFNSENLVLTYQKMESIHG